MGVTDETLFRIRQGINPVPPYFLGGSWKRDEATERCVVSLRPRRKVRFPLIYAECRRDYIDSNIVKPGFDSLSYRGTAAHFSSNLSAFCL
jgi:hypothetical protein